jgi:hypothetical protein
MLAQIHSVSTSPASEMQASLKALDEEVATLVEKDKRVEPSNAQLKQTLGVYANVMATAASLIKVNDDAIQLTGVANAPTSVTARVFIKVTQDIMGVGKDPMASASVYQKILDRQGVKWNWSDMQQLSKMKAADFVHSQAWIDRMEGWGTGYAKLTEDSILNGIQQGWGPNEVARVMRQHAENIPVYAAENLTRTLQTTAYREASLAMEEVNGAFIQHKIRVAHLDTRTCLSCVALHGTVLQPGERVDDHYRGRCTEFYVVPGGPEMPDYMQADSKPGKRNFVPFQSGEDWFKSLPPERQMLQESFRSTPAKYEAFRSGQVQLIDFAQEHHDDVFGWQIQEAALKDVVPEENLFYMRDIVRAKGGGTEVISEAVRRDVEAYGSGGTSVNFSLRTKRALDSREQEIVSSMDSIMKPSQKRLTLYRGVDEGTTRAETLRLYGTDARILPGVEFSDSGFASTSLNRSTAVSFALKQGNSPILFEIVAPKGTLMADMKPFASFGETEVLLARNTRFRVVKRTYDEARHLSILKLEIIVE